MRGGRGRPAGGYSLVELTMATAAAVVVAAGVYAIFALGAATVFATVAGIRTAARPGAWPHWPALVRGLGDAGFLCALIATFAGLREAMEVIAHLGAAVTPADMADGLTHSLFTLEFGAIVALAGLCGAALSAGGDHPDRSSMSSTEWKETW